MSEPRAATPADDARATGVPVVAHVTHHFDPGWRELVRRADRQRRVPPDLTRCRACGRPEEHRTHA